MKLINIAMIGLACVSSSFSFAGGYGGTGINILDVAEGARAAEQMRNGGSAGATNSGTGSRFPFCLIALGNKQCTYIDGNYCQQVAATLNGMCVTNPDFRSQIRGRQPFCVVSQSGTDCSYSDAAYCRTVAQSTSGGCIPNPNQ